MLKSAFIKKVYKGAQAGQKNYNIPASLTIAQAILESGWGKSGLTSKANNLFGVKADSSWHGSRIYMRTAEQTRAGKVYYINAPFRKYTSWDASVEDHAKFLNTARYAKVRQAKDYKTACEEIKKAGYATDVKYPDLLISIIKSNKLYKYDDFNASSKDYPDYLIKFNLKKKDKNVLKMKKELIKKGYMKSKSPNSIFGTGTLKAVKAFQKKNGLKVDGVVGKTTWEKLFK